MGLSIEDKWDNLRRQVEEDIAHLDTVIGSSTGPTSDLRAIHRALTTVLTQMDRLDRTGAHRA